MSLKRFIPGVVLLGAMILAAVPCWADMYMKQVSHTDAIEMMGQTQPERFDTTIMWIGDEWARSDAGDTLTMLYNLEKGELYFLKHADKQYGMVTLDLNEIIDQAMAEESEEDAEAAKAMANAMMGSVKVTVTPTDSTKKIGDWDTRKYDVDMSIMMMNLKQEIWATEDIDFDWSLYHAVATGMMAMMPGAANMVEEMMKVEGVPVLSVTTGSIMGAPMKSTTELVEAEDKDAPAGIYDIPKDYTKVEMSGMGGF
jgi:hypothetical protein